MTIRGERPSGSNEALRWDLSGLASDGALGVPRDRDSWTTPTAVWLSGGMIRWNIASPQRKVNPSKSLLDDFVGLGRASDEAILTFASINGICVICQRHRLPIVHSRLIGEYTLDVPYSCDEFADPIPGTPTGWYRELALWCRSALNVAAQLHDGKVGSEADWKILDPDFDPLADVLAGPRFRSKTPNENEQVADQREHLSGLLDQWLDLTGVRTRLEWERRPELRVRSGNVIGAVMTSLVLAITQSKGLATCTSCGRAYPPKRQPSQNRRNYCRDEPCQRAMRRDAQRDRRSRAKRGETDEQ